MLDSVSDTPSRLLKLLSLLQAPREWPGGELADRLQVSRRTIRRDVGRLRDLGYPVQGIEEASVRALAKLEQALPSRLAVPGQHAERRHCPAAGRGRPWHRPWAADHAGSRDRQP
jgi:biotin operon repressor